MKKLAEELLKRGARTAPVPYQPKPNPKTGEFLEWLICQAVLSQACRKKQPKPLLAVTPFPVGEEPGDSRPKRKKNE